MKRNLQLILTATTASFLAFPLMAQQDTPPRSDGPAYTRDQVKQSQTDKLQTDKLQTDRQKTDRLYSAAKASDIIGMTVNNHQDEKLGSVDDLAVDLESGRIVQVILSTGGFLGMGGRNSAVPPGALRYDAENKVLLLDATTEKLKSAPEFNTAKWAEHSDMAHISAVYTHYGQESASKFIQQGERSGDIATTPATRDLEGAWNKNRMTAANRQMIPASRLGQIQKASTLIGMAVKSPQDEKIGDVDNMLVDVQSGRIVAVVVSSGGFLGMGDDLSAVPPTALSFNADRDTLQLDTSREMLSAAPRFKSSQWPDFNKPAYSESVYRAYNVEPYFASNTAKDADNTARNERDRADRALTPMNQGNSKADTDTTAQIRKGILANKDMSVIAQNVKIITDQGRVTLRGPVQTEEEKRLIGEIANRIARAENVDNQLEVTVKTTSY